MATRGEIGGAHRAEAARIPVDALVACHETLAVANTRAQIEAAGIDACLRHLGAHAACMFARRGDEILSVRQQGYPPEVMADYGRQALGARNPGADAIRDGRPVFIRSVDELQARYPDLPRRVPELRAHAALPLAAGDQVFGDIVVSWTSERDFDEQEESVLRAFAGMLAQALWRATLLADAEKARAELDDFVSTSTIGLHWVGPDGRILWANEADHRMLGYARDEYVGHNIAEFHADAEDLAEIMRCVTSGERLVDRRATLRHKDGSLRRVVIDSSAYFEDDKFVHTRCFTRDETPLREQTDLYDALLRALSDLGHGVILARNGHEARYANEALAELVGRSVEEITRPGFDIRTLFASGELERLAAEMDLSDPDAPLHYRTRLQRPDGTSVHVEAASLGVTVRGENFRLAVCRDITKARADAEELDSARRELARTEKLAALGQLVSGVAHEVRTPLTIIEANAQLLRMRAESASRTQDASGLLDILPNATSDISGAIARANDLVRQLHRFARQPTGPARVVDLGEPIAEAVRLFETANKAYARVQMEISSLPPVHAEPAKVQQIVLNLLENAADAAGTAGGPVRVVADAEPDGSAIRIRVEDDGAGMAPDVLARMYDPLFTTKPHGTGLGLSIVKRIVEEHGGRIDCTSEPGRGTVFTVWLPVRAEAAEARAA